MANLFLVMMSVVFVVMGVGVESATHHAAPAPSAVDCSSLVLNMADCLTFVTSGSKTMKPEGGCCSGLKTVLKTDADCLCETFKNSAQLGINLNITKAATLPAACNVKAPSIANCGLSTTGGAPGGSPSLSPSVSPAGGPGTSDTAGASPGAAPPTQASAASVVSLSFVGVVGLFVASCL